jgi:hypothetical protein
MASIIEKRNLLPNRWYVSGERDHRGSLYVGVWDHKKEVFICIDTSQFGGAVLTHVPYIFDEPEDYPLVTFSPVTLIPDPNDVQTTDNDVIEEWPENDC